MIGVLFATQKEAAPFLLEMQSRATGVEEEDGVTRFELLKEAFGVAIIGMGIEAATRGVARFIERRRPTRVLNVGIAGALSDDMEIGAAVRISAAADRRHLDRGAIACTALGFEDLPAARLVTSDTPVFDDDVRRALRPFGDVVDMEGSVVASICESEKTPCTLIKCISDFASRGDRAQLQRNIDTASKTVAALTARRLIGAAGGLGAHF